MKQKINVTWQERNSGGEQIDLHHAEERNDSYRKKLVNVVSALKQHHPDGCSQVSQEGFSAESPKIFFSSDRSSYSDSVLLLYNVRRQATFLPIYVFCFIFYDVLWCSVMFYDVL